MKLRTSFQKSFSSDYKCSGILHGYMDYTYFYYTNDFLKARKLKLALVLHHMDMQFEIWLVGNTIDIQKKYWLLLRDSSWNIEKKEMPKYAILETVIVDTPNFDDLTSLEQYIQKKVHEVSESIIADIKIISC